MRPAFLSAFQGVAFLALCALPAMAETKNPAHDLAQKFALDGQEKPAAVIPQPATAPTAAAKAPDPTADAKAARPPRPSAPGPDYERDMLDAARAEADARRTTEPARTEAQPQPAPVAPQTQAAEKPKPAAAQAATQAQAPAPTAAATAAQTEAATQAPTPAATQTPVPPPAAASTQIKIEAQVKIPTATSMPVTRPTGAPAATILAVLTHNAQGAIRTIAPPDPIICLAETCYISAGPDKEARLISREDALSTKNTVTTGAGACKGMSRCAYRGVSMKPGDEIQIIDLGIVGHDKREPADVSPDTSCKVDDGDLVCEHPVTAPDYRIWVVPETVAASAGPGAIEAALADDLPEEDVARAEDK